MCGRTFANVYLDEMSVKDHILSYSKAFADLNPYTTTPIDGLYQYDFLKQQYAPSVYLQTKYANKTV